MWPTLPTNRRHNLKVLKRLGAPLQELKALGVALHLTVEILLNGVGRARHVDLHRVIWQRKEKRTVENEREWKPVTERSKTSKGSSREAQIAQHVH